MMKKYVCTLLYLLFAQYTWGQISNLTTTAIDSLVKHIDATCISGGITDYIIKSKKKGGKQKEVGSGADWYYTDTSRTRLVKVVQELSLASENFDTYYFYQDTLIYLTTINASYIEGKQTINWKRCCYFMGGNLILKQDNLTIPFIPKTYIETAKTFFVGDPIWRQQK